MPIYPEPHSTEWFEALLRTNPQQASMSSMVVKQAGRTDVCSICGDDPAADYKVLGAKGEETVASIRLCEDCRDIRTKMHGEKYAAL